MKSIFEVKDITGKLIHLSAERWSHINQDHPEISPYIQELQETLKAPAKVVKWERLYYNILLCKAYTMKGPMRVHYDEEGDFLEIGIGKPTACYAEQVQPGVFLRIDEKTKEVKSIGILNFKKRTKDPQDVTLDLPIEMNFSPMAHS